MRVYEQIREAIAHDNPSMAFSASQIMREWQFNDELEEQYVHDLTGALPSYWRSLVERGRVEPWPVIRDASGRFCKGNQ